MLSRSALAVGVIVSALLAMLALIALVGGGASPETTGACASDCGTQICVNFTCV